MTSKGTFLNMYHGNTMLYSWSNLMYHKHQGIKIWYPISTMILLHDTVPMHVSPQYCQEMREIDIHVSILITQEHYHAFCLDVYHDIIWSTMVLYIIKESFCTMVLLSDTICFTWNCHLKVLLPCFFCTCTMVIPCYSLKQLGVPHKCHGKEIWYWFSAMSLLIDTTTEVLLLRDQL